MTTGFGRAQFDRKEVGFPSELANLADNIIRVRGAAVDGDRRIRDFLVWHLGFWCRHVPRRPDGTYPSMQEREERFEPRSEEEALPRQSKECCRRPTA